MLFRSRAAFFISDRTGLTSESMGEALLDQFQDIKFKRSTYPFVDTPEKARAMVQIIETAARQTDLRPLVFSSIINEEIRAIIRSSPGLHLSFFDAFLGVLENELGTKARHEAGRAHGIADSARYRSEEHTSELQSHAYLVCRLLLEKKKIGRAHV